MAVYPLFVADMDTIKAPLRLSGTVSTDTLSAIDLAVKRVRTNFYKALGSARINAILVMPHSDTPSSDDEITRAIAENCETAWVKALLMQDLPMLFMDGSANTQQNWNQEGLVRDVQQSTLDKLVQSLLDQVQQMLGDIAGDAAIMEEPFNVSLIGPSCPNLPPGARTGVFSPFGGIIAGGVVRPFNEDLQ